MRESGRAGSSRGPGNLTRESGPIRSRIRVGFVRVTSTPVGDTNVCTEEHLASLSMGPRRSSVWSGLCRNNWQHSVVSEHGRGTHVYSYGWPDSVDNAQKYERTLLAVLPRMGPKGPIESANQHTCIRTARKRRAVTRGSHPHRATRQVDFLAVNPLSILIDSSIKEKKFVKFPSRDSI